MSVAKKDNWKSFQEVWTASFGVIVRNGKALYILLLGTQSVGGTLSLCIYFI